MEPKTFRTEEEAEFYTPERCYIVEIMNQPQIDFSIARARVEPGITTALHVVKETSEAYYILEGEGVVQSANGFRKDVGAGDVVLFPRGIEQKITNTGKQDLLFLAICVPRFTPAAYVHLEPNQ